MQDKSSYSLSNSFINSEGLKLSAVEISQKTPNEGCLSDLSSNDMYVGCRLHLKANFSWEIEFSSLNRFKTMP